MNKVEAIIRPERLERVKEALEAAGFVGLNVVNVTGRGAQKGVAYSGRGGERFVVDMLPKIKLELVVREADTQRVVAIIIEAARTGNIGDGKIFILPCGRGHPRSHRRAGPSCYLRLPPHPLYKPPPGLYNILCVSLMRFS